MMVSAGFTARARREEAAVDDVEVVDVVRLAVDVERRGLRIVAEANRAVLMRDAGERDALADEEVAREQALVALVAVDRRTCVCCFIRSLSFAMQPLVAFLVVRLVAEDDVAVAVERDAVVRDRADPRT